MSSWMEWKLAEKFGNSEFAEMSRIAYEDECRREELEDKYAYLECIQEDED